MSLFNHYKQNYRLWKQYKKLRKDYQQPNGYFPSETFFKHNSASTFDGKKVMNFGCGRSIYKSPNVLNVDIVADEGVVVRDPSKSLSQFGTDFDLIIANHVLEHVPDWFYCFKEMVEIVKPGGQIEVYVPPVSSDSSFTFRDHINSIGIRSFDGLGPTAHGGSNLFIGDEIKRNGILQKVRLVGHFKRPCVKWWMLLAWPSLMSWMTEHLRNVVSEEGFLFERLP